MRLNIPTEVARRIFEVVYQTGLETGVTLFGEKDGEDFTVKHIAGPGPDATHEELHYSGNEDYATMVFNELLKDDPNRRGGAEREELPIGRENGTSSWPHW